VGCAPQARESRVSKGEFRVSKGEFRIRVVIVGRSRRDPERARQDVDALLVDGR
jgi:hypothetical protein